MEALLGGTSQRGPSIRDDTWLQDESTSAMSIDPAGLALLHSESDKWAPTYDSQGSSPTSLEVALRSRDNGDPDLATIEVHMPEHLARSPWPSPTPGLQAFPLSERQRLPAKSVALDLVMEMFTNYNRFFPLFDQDDFLNDFHRKYSSSSPIDASWWACLNVVLSIAHRIRALRILDPTRENALAFGYIQNALGVVSALGVSDRSLSAVQALLGMACILQGTPNPEPASMLVAAALRLAQSMNLHRESYSPDFTRSEAELRRRVFWKAYILDKDISLRTCQPFGQDDDDLDVELPSNMGSDVYDVDFFNHRVGLAVIQGQVYKHLYSIRAGRQAKAQRALAAQELSSLLSYWKSKADSQGGSKMIPGSQLSGRAIHSVVLQLTYIHCLSMIDRHLSPASPSTGQELTWSELVPSPGSLCLAESRKGLLIFQGIPTGDRSCTWMLLHAFLSATSSVLYSLLQGPASPNALTDLHLVDPFLRLLETLATDPTEASRSEEIKKMHEHCRRLYNEAERAIQFCDSISASSTI
jgi:hypothetical protein